MEEKQNIGKHECLIPQAFKKRNFETCNHVSRLVGGKSPKGNTFSKKKIIC